MKKVIDYLTPRPALFFLLAALLWSGVMFFLNNAQAVQWKDIFVEANGMVFDLLVFGALLAWYDGKRQKNERIERDINLIEDYRGWDEKEASYRITAAIKRLNKAGLSNLNLNVCFLAEAELSGENLDGASLVRAKLMGTYLDGANLVGACLEAASLQGVQLVKANLSRAYLIEADLKNAMLLNTNFDETNLKFANLEGAAMWDATFKGANLTGVKLENAGVGKSWFEKLEYWAVVGKEEIMEKYKIDQNGRLQFK